MAPTILLADDDEDIRAVLRVALEAEGYHVVEAIDGDQALEKVDAFGPDLLLLDVMMPGINGTEICRRIRADSEVPIIFLSRRSEHIDRIIGLELGADDYIAKPFHPREVSARVGAVLRRSNLAGESSAAQTDEPSETLQHHRLTLEPTSRQVCWDGNPVDLTKTEFDLLRALMARPTKVYTREELIMRIHGPSTYVSERTIDSHVRNVRQKFEQAGAPSLQPIETVRGVGFTVASSS
ncbi:response regulator transcription factor [Persicimonas caeni]|uniref:Response regulator transcription factor n=1 Tax=Persicimonas caeni TaxID=2292766 RepID=A0A4Y6PWB2_PERCE|nr:response regulator transcription factor [Persicimonas caeni]QDG52543.1 response regulator transcription factor [Persicimonas caeni]QED33765.1 response regulator transcription factor [Persicimonas caeni]